jgi:hypothetical protein
MTRVENLDHEMAIQNYAKQQERAFDLLSSSSTTNAFDIQASRWPCASATARTSTA